MSQQAAHALVGQLQVRSGLNEPVVSAVEQVFAECLESFPDSRQLFGGLFLAPVCLGEAAFERFVPFLEFDDDLLKSCGIRCLSTAHASPGQQPEGGGNGCVMDGSAHENVSRMGDYFLPMPPWARKMRVGANSPSL